MVFNDMGPSGKDIMFNGTGFGLDPVTGSAMGEILTSLEADSFIVTHAATTSNKFKRIMIGTLVPTTRRDTRVDCHLLPVFATAEYERSSDRAAQQVPELVLPPGNWFEPLKGGRKWKKSP